MNVARDTIGKVYTDGSWDRPVEQVHQIELTTECNLRCVYCPHPKMKRRKEHMQWNVFMRAMDFVEHLCKEGTQKELSLTGVGEPTLHPKFSEALELAREVIGWERKLVFSTNGIEISKNKDLVKRWKRTADPVVMISGHRPEKAGIAYDVCKKAGLQTVVHGNFINNSFDWAGQVNWHVRAPQIPCDYLLQGWCVILASGEIATCCLDSEGSSIVGDVLSYNGENNFFLRPHNLCVSCHMVVPTPYKVESK